MVIYYGSPKKLIPSFGVLCRFSIFFFFDGFPVNKLLSEDFEYIGYKQPKAFLPCDRGGGGTRCW